MKHTSIFFLHDGVADKKVYRQDVRFCDCWLGWGQAGTEICPAWNNSGLSPLCPGAGGSGLTLPSLKLHLVNFCSIKPRTGFSFLRCWFSDVRTCDSSHLTWRSHVKDPESQPPGSWVPLALKMPFSVPAPHPIHSLTRFLLGLPLSSPRAPLQSGDSSGKEGTEDSTPRREDPSSGEGWAPPGLDSSFLPGVSGSMKSWKTDVILCLNPA